MMIGLGATPAPGDQCVDMSSYTAVPCSSPPSPGNLLCFDPASGQHGTCGNMPTGTPLPILTLADVMQLCTDANCQVIGAAPPGQVGCDPLIQAAGFACQSTNGINYWTKNTIQNGVLYTPNGTYAAPSANQYGLSPTQVSYLVGQGIIQQPTSMNAPITAVPGATPPATGPGASAAVQAAFAQAGQGSVNQLPIATNVLPSVAMTPATTLPTTVALGTGTPTPAAPNGGPQSYAPASATSNTGAGTSSSSTTTTDLIPGVPNTYLFIGIGAVLLLAVMK